MIVKDMLGDVARGGNLTANMGQQVFRRFSHIADQMAILRDVFRCRTAIEVFIGLRFLLALMMENVRIE